MHLLAYNLIRGVMAQAAEAHDKRPRQLSFKGTLQTITAFQEAMRRAAPADRELLLQAMLEAIAQQEVGDRPGRFEPRANKRRPKPQRFLMEPRPEARKRLLRCGIMDNLVPFNPDTFLFARSPRRWRPKQSLHGLCRLDKSLRGVAFPKSLEEKLRANYTRLIEYKRTRIWHPLLLAPRGRVADVVSLDRLALGVRQQWKADPHPVGESLQDLGAVITDADDLDPGVLDRL